MSFTDAEIKALKPLAKPHKVDALERVVHSLSVIIRGY